MRKLTLSFMVISVLLLIVAACSQPEPQTVLQTVVVEKEVEVVKEVEVEKEVEVVVTEVVEVEKEVEVVVEKEVEVVVTEVVEKEVEVEVVVTEVVEVEVEKEVEVEVEVTRIVEVEVQPTGADSEITVFAVQHAECAWDSFWCTVQAGITDAAEDLNINLTLLAPDEFDLDKQASLIEQAIAASPDAIMLTVPDPVLFAEPIQKALDAGIPVIAYNAGAGPDEDGIPYLTYLGQDEYAGGYLGGKRLLGAGGGSNAVCISHQVGHTGLDKRCAGFTDAMAEADVPVEVLAINNDPAESTTIIGDYFAANPGTDLFMTLGPNGATPFYAFVENEGLTADDFIHGTFDQSDEINAKIEAGITQFGIDQQPYLQGYGGVTILHLLIRYGIGPAGPITATGPGFVDAAALAANPDPEGAVKVFAVQHAECAWDSFWCVVQQGINDGAESFNVDLEILAPDEFDLDKQASLIEQAIAGSPDGIMLTVPDPVLFAEPIQKAIDAGIPVIAYNAGAGPEADGIPYLTYLGQDEYAGGYQGGKRLLAAGGGSNAVCISHQVGHTGLDKRCAGFTDAMAEADLPVEVLAINNDPAESTTIIGDYFAANPETDVFMTLGPNGATPFYAFIENEGLSADDFVHGTFDLSDEINANIANGTTQFGIDQQPYLQGFGGVQILHLLARHGISPANPITATGPGFVTIDNLELVQELAGTYR